MVLKVWSKVGILSRQGCCNLEYRGLLGIGQMSVLRAMEKVNTEITVSHSKEDPKQEQKVACSKQRKEHGSSPNK